MDVEHEVQVLHEKDFATSILLTSLCRALRKAGHGGIVDETMKAAEILHEAMSHEVGSAENGPRLDRIGEALEAFRRAVS